MDTAKKDARRRRALVAIIACVLALGCVIALTAAEYVANSDGTQKARVAKWGVTVTANQDSGFRTTYNDANGNLVVKSSTEAKLVAPGTGGLLFNADIAGKPETALTATYSGTVSLEGNWTQNGQANGTFYCPITVTISSQELNADGNAKVIEINGENYTSQEKFLQAINDAINGWTFSLAPNNELKGNDVVPVIEWEWNYKSSASDTTTTVSQPANPQSNAYDTNLGNVTNSSSTDDEGNVTITENEPKIKADITVTISQANKLPTADSTTGSDTDTGDTADGQA